MATEKLRYTVSVDKELFQKIEDFRFERRYQTRSEATVELIRMGLESLITKENDSSYQSLEDAVRSLKNSDSISPH